MSWWSDLYGTARSVMLLAEDLKRYQEDLKETQQQLQQLSLVVQGLVARADAKDKYEATERENMVLKMRLELQAVEHRLEHRLPPPPHDVTPDE